jgi:hypothetical protein
MSESEVFFSMKNNNTQSVRNPELKMALRALAANNSAENRSRMAEALVNAQLLSPIVRQTVLVENRGPAARIKFEEIRNTQGDAYYMAFTDMDEYNKWNEDGSHDHALIMTIQEFGDILIRNINELKGFVINPYGENVSISKSLLLSILKQHEAKETESEEEYLS